MPDANLIAFRKVSASSMPTKRRIDKSDLRMQLRNEIDKLALFVGELKAIADSVQKAADALGDELLLDSSDSSSDARFSHNGGRLSR
jgi:hypothetical protein